MCQFVKKGEEPVRPTEVEFFVVDGAIRLDMGPMADALTIGTDGRVVVKNKDGKSWASVHRWAGDGFV